MTMSDKCATLFFGPRANPKAVLVKAPVPHATESVLVSISVQTTQRGANARNVLMLGNKQHSSSRHLKSGVTLNFQQSSHLGVKHQFCF